MNPSDLTAVVLNASDEQLVAALMHRAKVSARPLRNGGVKVTLRLDPAKMPKAPVKLKRRYRRHNDPYGLMPNSR